MGGEVGELDEARGNGATRVSECLAVSVQRDRDMAGEHEQGPSVSPMGDVALWSAADHH